MSVQPVSMAIKKSVEKRETLYIPGGNVDYYSYYQNNMGVTQEIKTITTTLCSNLLLGIQMK
jgi:hypothetical protein